jgi:ubiquinone/menaquinone biosynthesis C-methylase UbiE
MRCLEIGPGKHRVSGFETLDVIKRKNVDHVGNAQHLPFPDNTFSVIYASHVLEHIPWTSTQCTVNEWARVLAPGGSLEIWVPDALKIAQAFVEAETRQNEPPESIITDPTWHANMEHDPCVWFSSRTFTWYHKRMKQHSYHRAAFTVRYLIAVMEKAGLTARQMDISEMRIPAHQWIGMGCCGVK